MIFPTPKITANEPQPYTVLCEKEAAAVVRRIFNMTLDGMGTHHIADILAGEKILTPTS